jgi:hypothetical protein
VQVERRPGTLQGALRGGGADLQHLRHLGDGEAEHVLQQQYGGLARWKPLHGGD